MPSLKKLAVLATAAKAAQRYVRENPDKADQYLGKAAAFADKRTKGKYSRQIDGVASKARSAVTGKSPRISDDPTVRTEPITPANPTTPANGTSPTDPTGPTDPNRSL